jgi:hypothetical protein
MLSVKLSNPTRTLQEIINKPGVSLDSIDKAQNMVGRGGDIQQRLSVIWGEITQKNRQNSDGSDFENIEREINEFYEQVSDFYGEVISESQQMQEVRKRFDVDKEEFVAAREFHRNQAKIFLNLLLVIIALSLPLVLFMFDLLPFLPANWRPDAASDLSTYTLRIGGRISVLLALGWLIRFVGLLHSNHSEQQVAYQDRIAGLSTSEMIVSSGRPSIREKILLEMSETYLSLRHNAFRSRKEKMAEANVEGLERFVVKIQEITKKLTALGK